MVSNWYYYQQTTVVLTVATSLASGLAANG